MAIQFLGTMPRNDPSNTPLALEIAKSVERGMIMEEERQQKDRLRNLQLMLASAEGVPREQRGAFKTKLATNLVDLGIPTDLANESAEFWASKFSESDIAQQRLEMQDTLAKTKAQQEALDKQKQADTRLATIASQTDSTGRLVKLPEAAINAIAELSGASSRARDLALGIHGFVPASTTPESATPAGTTPSTPSPAIRPTAPSAEVDARSVSIPSLERQKQLGIKTGAEKQPSSGEKSALDWLNYSAARLQNAKTPEEKRIFTEDVQAARARLDKARDGVDASASTAHQKLDSTAPSAEVEARSVPIPSPERQRQLGIKAEAKKQPDSNEKSALNWLNYSTARLQSAKTPEEKRIFTEDVQAARASLGRARGRIGAGVSPFPQKLNSMESETPETTTPTPIDPTKLSQESRNTLEAMRRTLPTKIYNVLAEAQKTPGVYHWDEGTLNYVRWQLGLTPAMAKQFLLLNGYNPDPKAPVLYFKERDESAPQPRFPLANVGGGASGDIMQGALRTTTAPVSIQSRIAPSRLCQPR